VRYMRTVRKGGTIIMSAKVRKLYIDVMNAISRIGRYVYRSDFIRDALRRHIDGLRSGVKYECREEELESLAYRVLKIPVLSHKLDSTINTVTFKIPEQLADEISSTAREFLYPTASDLIREAIRCRMIEELKNLESKANNIFEYKEKINIRVVE